MFEDQPFTAPSTLSQNVYYISSDTWDQFQQSVMDDYGPLPNRLEENEIVLTDQGLPAVGQGNTIPLKDTTCPSSFLSDMDNDDFIVCDNRFTDESVNSMEDDCFSIEETPYESDGSEDTAIVHVGETSDEDKLTIEIESLYLTNNGHKASKPCKYRNVDTKPR